MHVIHDWIDVNYIRDDSLEPLDDVTSNQFLHQSITCVIGADVMQHEH
jgi:hypothetical protein